MITDPQRLTRPVHYARGYVALVAGRPDEAAAEFEHLTEHGAVAPAARSRFATGMAPQTAALSRAGRIEDARRVADEELAWAETWGAPRFMGIALRGSANALDYAERIQTLQQSVALLDKTAARLELARALGDLGSVLRRNNQRGAAREPLRQALDLAQRCRADDLTQQLRGELRAAGAKPWRDVLTGKDSLTASETRIAEMAATGMTNSQIGQAIFVTPGTVEKHLTSVYSKLNISSRQALAAALGQDRGTTTNARYDRPTRE